MSFYMQYAPYKLRDQDWEGQRERTQHTVVETLTQYAPNLQDLILKMQTITPKDLEDCYGLTGGTSSTANLAMDQFFTMRPLLGWARYGTPIPELVSLWVGHTSRHRPDRRFGGECGSLEILKELKSSKRREVKHFGAPPTMGDEKRKRRSFANTQDFAARAPTPFPPHRAGDPAKLTGTPAQTPARRLKILLPQRGLRMTKMRPKGRKNQAYSYCRANSCLADCCRPFGQACGS